MGEWTLSIIPPLFWFYAYLPAYVLIRRFAKVALIEFDSALDVSLTERNTLNNNFINTSPRTSWLLATFSLIYVLFGINSLKEFMGEILFTSYNLPLTLVELIALTPISIGFSLYVFRTIRLIPQFYAKVTKINLFNLSPLYAFSGFSSKVGIAFLVFLVFTVITNLPEFGTSNDGVNSFSGPNGIYLTFYLISFSIIATIVFITPLVGIHNRLVTEKNKITEENNANLNIAYRNLQERMTSNNLEGINDLRGGISTLLDFRREIKLIPTWPWEKGTLFNFISALLFPILLWLIQRFLAGFVGF